MWNSFSYCTLCMIQVTNLHIWKTLLNSHISQSDVHFHCYFSLYNYIKRKALCGFYKIQQTHSRGRVTPRENQISYVSRMGSRGGVKRESYV